MSDKFDQEAEALLPCECGGVYVDGVIDENKHAGPCDPDCCSAYYRPAVAARLRADGRILDYWTEYQEQLSQAQTEKNTAEQTCIKAFERIDELKTEIERLKTQLLKYET